MPEELERRGLERRTEQLEIQCNKLEMRVTLLEVKVDGLISTQKSNFDAVNRGQELILAKLGQLALASDVGAISSRVTILEAVRYRVSGAFALLVFLGLSGIVGGILAIVRSVKGP